jgi:CRISPR-associated protein Cas1
MNVVLNSFGSSVSVKDGNFLFKSAAGEEVVFPSDIRSITLSKGASISSDAIILAIQNEIDVFFVDNLGKPQGKIWSVKYGSVSTIRQMQIEFLYSDKALPWVKNLITSKIKNQISVLLCLQNLDHSALNLDIPSLLIDRTINALNDYIRQVDALEASSVSEAAPSLRGWEGQATKRYFQAVFHYIPHPFRPTSRSLHPPTDPFNAALSYAYGMLYSVCESALIKAGIDPYVGIFHRDQYNRPALVFDFIELFRYWADFVVFHLFIYGSFIDDCFTRSENACLLDGLGKRIVIQAMNDYLAEIITIQNKERSRLTFISEEAHALAKKFLELQKK